MLHSHHLQFWISDVEGNKFHEFGKTLIEPQVIPPLHCHQVPKPLDRQKNMSEQYWVHKCICPVKQL